MPRTAALRRPPPAPGPVPGAGERLLRGDFDRLTAHIHDLCGISIPRTKALMLEGRLRRRVRTLGMDSMAAYCAWLFEGADGEEETAALINAVTTNKTDFFREPAHFTYLETTVLPEFRAHCRHRMRIWSAACSTGAEPYSLAMVLDSVARDRRGPGFGLLATDIDTDVLATARRGVYPAEQLAPVPRPMRERYVLSARDAARNDCRIVPELRAAIGFGRLNLIERYYPVGEPMDVIFCRNVLIYFDKETQARIVTQLADALRPGGYLFLGHSESALGASPALTPILAPVASAVFRRR